MSIIPSLIPGERKEINLAMIKTGAKDFLDFLDASKEVFHAYLYHRTGSEKAAREILTGIYSSVLVRTMSLWWFGALNLRLLLDRADRALAEQPAKEADIDRVYIASFPWLTAAQRTSLAGLHDALWSLPPASQRLLILSMLVGLSDERIAGHLSMPLAEVTAQIAVAKKLLLERWHPVPELAEKLGSLIFVPSLDLKSETELRFAMVEKYNALRLRRYQWVIIGGFFAVMSNVIVASVLAFAVVTQPPTSLRGVRMQVASLDAVLLNRQLELSDADDSVRASFRESQRIAAYSVSRDFTELGLSSALEALTAEQKQEEKVDRLQKLLEHARTAMAPILRIALEGLRAMLAAVPWAQVQ